MVWSPRVVAESGLTTKEKDGYFLIWNLPAYYVCVMVCKIGGGGDSNPENVSIRARSGLGFPHLPADLILGDIVVDNNQGCNEEQADGLNI